MRVRAVRGVAAIVITIMIGGVGYRWQGDGSFGLIAADRLAAAGLPPSVLVADLGYGAIYAAQDIAAARPDRLILIAAVPRGDAPGSLRQCRYDRPLPAADEILARIREAGAGVIDIDHLLVIAHHMEALPADVTVIEVEPLEMETASELSPLLESRLEELVHRLRSEMLAAVEQT